MRFRRSGGRTAGAIAAACAAPARRATAPCAPAGAARAATDRDRIGSSSSSASSASSLVSCIAGCCIAPLAAASPPRASRRLAFRRPAAGDVHRRRDRWRRLRRVDGRRQPRRAPFGFGTLLRGLGQAAPIDIGPGLLRAGYVEARGRGDDRHLVGGRRRRNLSRPISAAQDGPAASASASPSAPGERHAGDDNGRRGARIDLVRARHATGRNPASIRPIAE